MNEKTLTYTEYQNRKLANLEANYRLALEALAMLDELDADLRDADWEAYRTLVARDATRLALDLPLFIVGRINEEMES